MIAFLAGFFVGGFAGMLLIALIQNLPVDEG